MDFSTPIRDKRQTVLEEKRTVLRNILTDTSAEFSRRAKSLRLSKTAKYTEIFNKLNEFISKVDGAPNKDVLNQARREIRDWYTNLVGNTYAELDSTTMPSPIATNDSSFVGNTTSGSFDVIDQATESLIQAINETRGFQEEIIEYEENTFEEFTFQELYNDLPEDKRSRYYLIRDYIRDLKKTLKNVRKQLKQTNVSE